MTILDIIEKKRDKKELTKEEIEYFVKGYSEGKIADYQAAALIMAIYIQGMTEEETTNLTLAMAHSGEILDLSKLEKVVVDKLESITGYKTDIDIHTFIENVDKIGISMISQTLNLAPADKKIYALRDSIACVESIPLIASSIMSKKIASGAEKIVIDVTVGSGAFMKNLHDAEKLAKEMIAIGKLAGRETICVLTNMDEPLGKCVGNALEVREAIKALKGDIEDDVKKVVLELGTHMVILSGIADKEETARKMLENNLENGKAYKKFIQMVERQGGDISYLENIESFEESKYIEPIYSEESGYIYNIDAEKVGKLACTLGTREIKKENKIDPSVGIVLLKKVGHYVEKGEVLAYLHLNNIEQLNEAKEKMKNIVKIRKEKTKKLTTIIKVIK